MTSLSIFVVSHDDGLLAAVPPLPALRPVDLRELGLPADLAGNSLAESRFFLSERALDVTTEYVGVLSARHDEKYGPRTLSLEQLGRGAIIPFLQPQRVFAPLLTDRDGGWFEGANRNHPGLTALMREAAELIPGVDLSRRSVYANSFIARHDVFRAFVEEFRRLFGIFHERYGLDFPHNYRCPTCETVFEDGFGRYQRDRHAAFFYERITSLHFARAPFEVIDLRPERFMSGAQFAVGALRSLHGQVARYRRDRLR